jgi:NAD(P)H-dependent FMN reductase
MYKEYGPGQAPQVLEELAEKFRNSDGFLIVTGEYNHGIPPAMKNTLDYFQTEYFFKPSAIACYSSGSFGGVRAAIQLRSVTGELGMPSISSIQPFPNIGKNFDKTGNPQDQRIEKSTRRFIDEFLWYLEAFKTQRDKGTPY